MAWSYSLTTLATTPKDQVRYLLGDTLQTDQQVQDEEINFALTLRGSIYGATAQCCRSLAAQLSRKADSVQGDLHTLYSAQAKAYAARAVDYEARAAAFGAGTPYFGGISVADKQQQEADTDRVQPQTNLGMDDNYLPVGPAGNETIDNGGSGVS